MVFKNGRVNGETGSSNYTKLHDESTAYRITKWTSVNRPCLYFINSHIKLFQVKLIIKQKYSSKRRQTCLLVWPK